MTSERFEGRLCQAVCFTGALFLAGCSILAPGRLGAPPAELLIGLLAASATAFGMIVMGCLSEPKAPAV